MEQDNKRPCIQDTDIPDLEALKGALEHREALKIKAERIRETALSRIKAREKASRRQISRSNEKTPDESTTTPSGGSGRKLSATNTAAKEKSDQLKKKLEEARAKVESMRGQENLGKVNEVVESIRVQIEDREKVLQEMLTIHSAKTTVEPDAPMDMEPAIPDEIKQRIAGLEAQVLDLQENLKEKDSVIAARTQAITLLSEDMSRKSKERIDNLEETQEQMRQMQRNFIVIEERMREEQLKLAQQAEERKQRCVQAEKNLRQAESARFDLSTRVAELQEKVVSLQEKNIELEKSAADSQHKQQEMKESLDAANKLTIKMKAQFKAKMKSLEEERDTLKRMSESGQELSRLQNRIAELEEEKGNLQLSLLDFDEQQELCNTLKARIEELESKTKHQDGDLDSHVKLISQLEKEKLDLIHGTQQYNAMLKEKDTLIDRLQQQLAELNRLKVSAEMRAVELEEKLDLGIREQRRADDEDQGMLENMRNELVKYEETVRELQEKLSRVGGTSEKDDVIQKLTTELDEWKLKYFEMETQYNSMVEVYRSLENRVAGTEAQNESVVRECEQLRQVIGELESSVVRMNSSEVREEVVAVKESVSNVESVSYVESVSNVKSVSNVESGPNMEPERFDEKDFEIDRLRHELQAATEELHRLNSLVEDYNNSSEKLNELNMQIDEKDRALQETCNELEKRRRKLSEYKKFHKLKSEDVIRVSHELETVTAASQEKIGKLEEDLAKSRETITELQKQLEGAGSGGVGSSGMEQKMKKLAANLKIKVKACKEMEAKIAAMEVELEGKCQEVKRVSDERNDVVRCMEEKQNAIEDLNSANKKLTVELSELRSVVAEFKSQGVGNSDLESRLNAAAQLESDYVRVNELLKQKQIEVEQLRGELCAAKEEMNKLFNKLQETTMRSEQADAKLQEKDGYIESLECELNKTRDRVQSIESSVEERRRSLEEKAESLGIRLLRAETANEEFERHGGELERQLAYLAENENYLQTSLINMRNENDGLRRTVEDLNAQINVFIEDLENNRSTITHLQKELGAAREVQEAYNQNIEELDRLNTANKQLKAGKEKLVMEFEEREKQMMENVEEEMKSLNEKLSSVENERQELYRKLEEISNENSLLKQEADLKKVLVSQLEDSEQQRVDLERRFLEANNKVSVYEERLQGGPNRSDVEEIMAEQKQLMENLKVEFENRETNYLTQIRELQDYNTELLRSLEAIERNAGNLKTELSRVGLELAASKEELIAMRADQGRSSDLQAKLVELKDNYEELLAKERNAAASLKELLREKAREGVEELVSEAESRASMVSQQQQKENIDYFQQHEQQLQSQQIQQQENPFNYFQQQDNLQSLPQHMQQQQQKPLPTLFTFPTTNDPTDDPFSKVEPVVTSATNVTSFFQQPVQPHPFSENKDQIISELEAKLRAALEENQRLSGLVGAASNVVAPPRSEINDQLISELEGKLRVALEENQRLSGFVGAASNVVTETDVGLAQSSGAVGRHLESKDEEDGWGWGGDESVTEQSPVKKSETMFSGGDQRVMELERRLQEYQNDNCKLAEELKESNLKCAKLLKKAKELKAKSEHLEKGSRQQSVGFEDLDFAMQEELRERIGVLEKSLQEAKNEAKNWKVEKENLTRRVDTLTCGNERLVEMKERQDVEVAMWQKQNSELKHCIQGLEWKIEELSDESHQQSTPDVEQLKEKLSCLESENEQLMKVLNEMKDKHVQLGGSQLVSNEIRDKNSGVSQPTVTSEDNQQLRLQIENLEKLYNQAQTDLEELTRHNASILSANESINARFDSFKVEIDQLAAENEKLRGELAKIEDISTKYSSFSAEFEHLKNENTRIGLLEEENRLMKEIVSTAEEQLKAYKNKLSDNEKNLVKIDGNYMNLKREFERLLGINDENSELLEKLRLENCDLRATADDYKKRLDEGLKKEDVTENIVTGNVAVEKNVEEPVTSRQFAPVLFEGFKSDDNAESNDPFSFSTQKEEASSSNAPPPAVTPDQTELVDEIVKTNQHEQDEEDLKELKEEVCNLNTLLDEKEDELEITLQSVDSFRLERENLADEWNEKLKSLKTKNSSATVVKAEAYREQLNIAYKKFQNELLLKEEEIAHLTCELSAKEQLLMNSATELENVQTEAEKALIKLREVESELEKRNSEFDKLRHEMDCLCSEYSSLQRTLEEKARYIEGLEITKEEADVLREQLLQVQSQLKEAMSGNEVLREKRSSVDDSFYDLEHELRQELAEKTASLAELKAKHEELEKRAGNDVNVSEWERVVREKDEKLSELERVLYEKDVKLSEWERFASEKDVKLSEWERYASENNVKLSEWERYASEKDVKLSEWERYANENNVKLSELERVSSEKDVKLLELEGLCIEKDVKFSELEKVSSEKDVKLSSLEQAYTECYDELQKSQNTIASLEESLRQLQATKEEQPVVSSVAPPVASAVRDNLGDDGNWKEYLMAEVERCREMIAKRDAEIVRLKQALVQTQEALAQANEAVQTSSYNTVHSFKQRLDEALYTLHVRDLRCEELTHELLQLLAERDELQLRLSASIKLNESSREKIEKSTPEKSTGLEQQAVDFPSSAEVTPPVYVLNEKLGELQQTDYRKDLSLQRDREQRYIEQQHLYSNAPPEEHTEHESGPSFFGWLFGASK